MENQNVYRETEYEKKKIHLLFSLDKKEKWDVPKFFFPIFQTPTFISYC